MYFFFFQAEDGIRDYKVTGVQTCALPISAASAARSSWRGALCRAFGGLSGLDCATDHVEAEQPAFDGAVPHGRATRLLQAHLAGQLEVGREHPGAPAAVVLLRSEEHTSEL